MACENAFDAFRLATESLPDDLHVRASYRSIWLNLIRRGVYPKGAGLVRSTFTIGRSEPATDEPEFAPIAFSNGDAGSCGTTYNDMTVGFNEGSYVPEKFGWRGPIVCQDDISLLYMMEDFLRKYVPAITKFTERTISNRFASIYAHLVPRAVANTDFHFEDGDTGTPGTSPVLDLDESTCFIDQEMLDYTAEHLNEEGASDDNANSDGWITLGEDGPIYPLYIGQMASAQLLLQNAELRQDRRDADSGEGNAAMLFKRIGATKIIKNFRHVINLFPPRYSYANGVYTRVPTWVMNAGTKGEVADINPDWRSTTTAPYEGMYVLSPWVFTSEIVPTFASAAGLNWSPKNHVGELQFVVGGNEISTTACYDPLKKLGAHFGEFHHAPRPDYPTYGRLIIFKRCPATFACTACS